MKQHHFSPMEPAIYEDLFRQNFLYDATRQLSSDALPQISLPVAVFASRRFEYFERSLYYHVSRLLTLSCGLQKNILCQSLALSSNTKSRTSEVTNQAYDLNQNAAVSPCTGAPIFFDILQSIHQLQ